MFSSHVVVHQQPAAIAGTSAKQKVPRIDRPEIKQDASDEDWDTFNSEWNRFKRCTYIPPQYVADQLFQCCERNLGRLLIKENPNIIASGEEQLLKAMKRMAVIKIATSIRRANLLATKQDHGESFREFYANVKAAAATCDFSINCPNTCCVNLAKIDYTPMVIKDVLIAGIADNEIRKDLLGLTELDAKTDKEIVTFVEEKEIAKNAWSGKAAGAAGISNYKKPPKNEDDADTHTVKKKLAMKGKCSKCDSQICLYIRYRNGMLNKTPFQTCITCYRETNPSSRMGNHGDVCQRVSGKKSLNATSESSAINSFIGAFEVQQNATTGPSLGAHKRPVILHHHIFTHSGWQKASAFKHPTVRLRIETNKDDYIKFGIAYPRIAPKHIDVIVDSGAQSCLWSRK